MSHKTDKRARKDTLDLFFGDDIDHAHRGGDVDDNAGSLKCRSCDDEGEGEDSCPTISTIETASDIHITTTSTGDSSTPTPSAPGHVTTVYLTWPSKTTTTETPMASIPSLASAQAETTASNPSNNVDGSEN